MKSTEDLSEQTKFLQQHHVNLRINELENVEEK